MFHVGKKFCDSRSLEDAIHHISLLGKHNYDEHIKVSEKPCIEESHLNASTYVTRKVFLPFFMSAL